LTEAEQKPSKEGGIKRALSWDKKGVRGVLNRTKGNKLVAGRILRFPLRFPRGKKERIRKKKGQTRKTRRKRKEERGREKKVTATTKSGKKGVWVGLSWGTN